MSAQQAAADAAQRSEACECGLGEAAQSCGRLCSSPPPITVTAHRSSKLNQRSECAMADRRRCTRVVCPSFAREAAGSWQARAETAFFAQLPPPFLSPPRPLVLLRALGESRERDDASSSSSCAASSSLSLSLLLPWLLQRPQCGLGALDQQKQTQSRGRRATRLHDGSPLPSCACACPARSAAVSLHSLRETAGKRQQARPVADRLAAQQHSTGRRLVSEPESDATDTPRTHSKRRHLLATLSETSCCEAVAASSSRRLRLACART